MTCRQTGELVGLLALFAIGMFLLLPAVVFDVVHHVGDREALPPMTPRRFALMQDVRFYRDAHQRCWAVTPSDSFSVAGQ
jgi:hypothetical protein